MNRGFTVVELLAVIVVLTLISGIITVNVLRAVRNTDEYLEDTTKEVLYTATQRYLYDNVDLKDNSNYVVTIKTLISNEYLTSYFIEAQDNKNLTENSCVKVTTLNGSENYEFSYKCR